MNKHANKIEKLIAELCPEGVEFKELGEITTSIKTGLNPRQNFRLNSVDAKNYYVTVKEITTGKIKFSEKTDRINDDAIKIIQNRSDLAIGDVLFSGIGTIGKVALVDISTKNWNCSESVFVIKPKQEIVFPKYLMYILGSHVAKEQYQGQSVGSTLKGVRMATLSVIKIPIPPLAVQKEIAKILDTFTKLEAELEAELEARKKQYEYYRNELLTFGEGVEFKELGEVCEIADNKRKPVKSSLRVAGEIPYYGANNIQDYVEGFTHEGDYVLIAEDGSASLEKYSIQFASGKFWANNHVHVVRGDSDLHNKFLFHYLRNINFVPYLTGGTRAKLTKGKMLEIKIPIPPLAEQERIVAILDKFDALVNGNHPALTGTPPKEGNIPALTGTPPREGNLSASLPAELNARRKQYGYYRDKLLTFKKFPSSGGVSVED